jgi:hypothetical protein
VTANGRFLDMQALPAYTASMQYTLRDVPPVVDSELRKRARVEGKSLNAVALEALARGAGVGPDAVRQRDLGDIAGTWEEDHDFDDAVAAQHRIDKRLWR